MLLLRDRYRANLESETANPEPFLPHGLSGLDWFTCAFGRWEQQSVLAATDAGRHARRSFENNLRLPRGGIAPQNVALTASLAVCISEN
jgi:uncharacterized protein (DUF849 family)